MHGGLIQGQEEIEEIQMYCFSIFLTISVIVSRRKVLPNLLQARPFHFRSIDCVPDTECDVHCRMERVWLVRLKTSF